MQAIHVPLFYVLKRSKRESVLKIDRGTLEKSMEGKSRRDEPIFHSFLNLEVAIRFRFPARLVDQAPFCPEICGITSPILLLGSSPFSFQKEFYDPRWTGPESQWAPLEGDPKVESILSKKCSTSLYPILPYFGRTVHVNVFSDVWTLLMGLVFKVMSQKSTFLPLPLKKRKLTIHLLVTNHSFLNRFSAKAI